MLRARATVGRGLGASLARARAEGRGEDDGEGGAAAADPAGERAEEVGLLAVAAAARGWRAPKLRSIDGRARGKRVGGERGAREDETVFRKTNSSAQTRLSSCVAETECAEEEEANAA
jgi:hypothetical protein